MNIFELLFKTDQYTGYAVGDEDKTLEEVRDGVMDPSDVEEIKPVEGIPCWYPVHKETGEIAHVYEPIIDPDDFDIESSLASDYELREFLIIPVED